MIETLMNNVLPITKPPTELCLMIFEDLLENKLPSAQTLKSVAMSSYRQKLNLTPSLLATSRFVKETCKDMMLKHTTVQIIMHTLVYRSGFGVVRSESQLRILSKDWNGAAFSGHNAEDTVGRIPAGYEAILEALPFLCKIRNFQFLIYLKVGQELRQQDPPVGWTSKMQAMLRAIVGAIMDRHP
ncbi:hypothetical protein LTS18_009057 [Coniosporium uncinatum]|uniref:Uncharacterized protein n=1 Tax=Coniosporium uncinatum TaxID=93489 RepID=A0ACC3D0Z5_9PEZI|nr:hypothetical protein LTS18_009057 [Coniosporium uncinatum]